MKILPAHLLSRPYHVGYLGFQGFNPNIEVVADIDDADYVWYAFEGDGGTAEFDLRLFGNYAKPLIVVATGDDDYEKCVKDKNLLFTVNTKRWTHCIPYTTPLGMHVPPRERHYLASFRGSFSTDPNREAALKAVASPDVLVEQGEWWTANKQAQRLMRYRYEVLLRESRFTLCPRGRGPSSIRLTEAMLADTVPIMIDDWTRLFDQEMEFAIRTSWSGLAESLEFCRTMGAEEYAFRRAAMALFVQEYLRVDEKIGGSGTLGYTEYIRQVVERG